MADVLLTLAVVCFVLAVLAIICTIVLFFRLDIRAVIAELSGKTATEAIARIREEGTLRQHGGRTLQSIMDAGPTGASAASGTVSETVSETASEMKTGLLVPEQKTELLVAASEQKTGLLAAEQKTELLVAASEQKTGLLTSEQKTELLIAASELKTGLLIEPAVHDPGLSG